MNLTAKQEAFAQCVANGMTQSDAYRTAYDVSPETTAKSVNELSSRLMAVVMVKARVRELQDLLAMAEMWSRQDSVTALRDIVIDGESRAGEKTAAVKELNAMYGFNAPTKSQVTADVSGNLSINVNLVKPNANA